MSIEGQKFFPGETATAREILLLANAYRRAAETLRETGRRRDPLSWAPYRMTGIHAIELYLNALLLSGGLPPGRLRGLHHDLAKRTELALHAGLALRKRTLAHLRTLSEKREYLITRYDPAMSETSQLNRMGATLMQVAEAVTRLIDRAAEHGTD